MEIICPIILVLVGGAISQVEFINDTPDFGNKDLSKVGKQEIIFADYNDNNLSNYYIKNTTNVTNKDILFHFPTNETKTKEKAIEKFINLTYNDYIKQSEMTE